MFYLSNRCLLISIVSNRHVLCSHVFAAVVLLSVNDQKSGSSFFKIIDKTLKKYLVLRVAKCVKTAI